MDLPLWERLIRLWVGESDVAVGIFGSLWICLVVPAPA